MSQRARDGGANMPRDGRYIAKSQGWRCEYAQECGLQNKKIEPQRAQSLFLLFATEVA